MNILYAILMFAAGFTFVKYSYNMVRIFGHIDWVESRLGPGSSYAIWKAGGVLLIIGSYFMVVDPARFGA